MEIDVELLLEAGVSNDQIVRLMREKQADQRELKRQRQARWRERKKLNKINDSVDDVDVSSVYKEESFPHTPFKEENIYTPNYKNAHEGNQGELLAGLWPENDWELWWNAYPRKEGFKPAKTEFNRLRHGGELSWTELMQGTIWYANHADPEFLCMPARWLLEGRWKDRPIRKRRQLTQREKTDAARSQLRASIEREESGGYPVRTVPAIGSQ